VAKFRREGKTVFINSSGLKVQQSFTVIEVYRDRYMIVNDHPFAIGLVDTTGGAKPEVRFLSAFSLPVNLSRA